MNRMVVQKLHIDGQTYDHAPCGNEIHDRVKGLLAEVSMNTRIRARACLLASLRMCMGTRASS